jgi:hypothetical protein
MVVLKSLYFYVHGCNQGRGPHAGMKKDEYGYTLENLKKLLLAQEQPFIFSSQVSQGFFIDYV